MLWGYVRRVDERTFTVDEISSTGQPDGESKYPFSTVSYFDDDPVYAERLVRLANFKATLPDSSAFSRARRVINHALQEAVSTGEIINIRLRSEAYARTVRVVGLDKDWVEFAVYDDLMRITSTEIWRRSTVEGVRWRTETEEADAFLLARNGSRAPF